MTSAEIAALSWCHTLAALFSLDFRGAAVLLSNDFTKLIPHKSHVKSLFLKKLGKYTQKQNSDKIYLQGNLDFQRLKPKPSNCGRF